MASSAVRRADPTLLLGAIFALVVGGLDQHLRESLMVMAPLEDSAARLDMDLAELFEDASTVVGNPGAVNLMMWLTRLPEDRPLACMAFVATEDEDGFRYRLDPGSADMGPEAHRSQVRSSLQGLEVSAAAPLWKEVEPIDMPGSHHPHVAMIQGRDVGHSESLGQRHQRGVGRAQLDVSVPNHELGYPQPVGRVHGFGREGPAGKIAEEEDLGVRTQPLTDQVGGFADDELRDDERPGVGGEQLQALGVMTVVAIDIRIERAGVDDERGQRASARRISLIRSPMS
jgi:hypothetical protein